MLTQEKTQSLLSHWLIYDDIFVFIHVDLTMSLFFSLEVDLHHLLDQIFLFLEAVAFSEVDGCEDVFCAELFLLEVGFLQAECSFEVHSVIVLVFFVVNAGFGFATDRSLHLLIVLLI